MDYQIIRAVPEIGQIEVLYKDGDKLYGVYAIDVPVVDGKFLTGDALHEEILHRAPVWATQREQEIATATGFSDIEELVTPFEENSATAEQQANSAMWAQVEYEKKLAKALIKFGLLTEDPTAVETTQL